MDEGFPGGRRGVTGCNRTQGARHSCIALASALVPEPVVCVERCGPTPSHLEPGRETQQRRWYWRVARWESRSVHPAIAAWSSGSSSGS